MAGTSLEAEVVQVDIRNTFADEEEETLLAAVVVAVDVRRKHFGTDDFSS